jgi:hypothetical protein
MRRNRWTAILFAVFLFCCGVVCGVMAQRYLSATVSNTKTAEDFRHRYVSEMKTKLKLTPDQVNRLEVILDETKAQYKAVRDESRPAMLKIKEEQIRRVESILSPEQVPAYEKLVAERERKFRQQEERDRQADLKREAAHRAQASH